CTDGSQMNIAVRPRQLRTSAIEIRLGELADIPALIEVLGQFFHETTWAKRGLTFDAEKVEKALQFCAVHKTQPYLIARSGDEIVGLISWHYWSDFCEPIAVMDETWLRADYRRTDLGRKLVALAIYMAKGDGARLMNFPLCSGLDETRTYVNMLRKFGC